MLTIHAISGRTITLGREGENLARQVVFDISEWHASYGDGVVSLIAQRSGDDEPYPCNITVDGSTVKWEITAADTARKGYGKCELRYTVGDVLVKSKTWNTYTADALGTPAPEPPEPAKNWVDAVLKSSSDAKQSATESAESARQAAESSANAANSANEAHKSREAIENMEASAVSLPPDSAATVEKAIADGKVKLTFGIPKGEKGESDIFWLTTNLTAADSTEGEVTIDKTAEEIISAYKSGRTIFWNIIVTEEENEELKMRVISTLKQSMILDLLDESGAMSIFLSTNVLDLDGGCTAVSGYIAIDINDNKMYTYLGQGNVGLLSDKLPVEPKLYGAAREDELELGTYAAYYNHVHPAPFPDWTNNIGKALFVNNANETPSQAFEWRDVPNGDFTSKVGDFLRVAEVDSNNKPTKWATESIANAKGVNF